LALFYQVAFIKKKKIYFFSSELVICEPG
jgi:hypothetical protein